MSTANDWNQQHQETLQNIPWFVTGRLSAEETAAASLHIALCKVCQQELEAQRHIRDMMLAPDPIEVAPQASFHKLRSRIEEIEREMPADVRIAAAGAASGASSAPPSPTPPSDVAAPGWLRPVLLAQLAAGVLAASLLLWSAFDRWTAPRFQTATTVARTAAQRPALRVVAAKGVSVEEFAGLLRDAQARVVAGPNDQNAWTVALPAPAGVAARDALLQRWHGDARILFAEPVAESAPP